MTPSRRSSRGLARLGPAVKVLLFCLACGAAGVGYVWQKNQIYTLAQDKKKCENSLENLRRQNKSWQTQLAYLQLPSVLEARVKELNLGLVIPEPEQVVRLAEASFASEPAKPAAIKARQLASRAPNNQTIH